MQCLTKNYSEKIILIINSLFIGYGDRRRYNDNESTTYDAQEMNGNLIFKCIIQSIFLFVFFKKVNNSITIHITPNVIDMVALVIIVVAPIDIIITTTTII